MKFPWETKTMHHGLIIFIAAAFLFGAIFSMLFGMQPDERGNMSGCPFMSAHASICPMGVMEHIAKWQQFSNAVFSKSGSLAAITFLFVAVMLFVVSARRFYRVFSLGAVSLSIPKIKPETKLFDHVVIAFAQGILNPRLYA